MNKEKIPENIDLLTDSVDAVGTRYSHLYKEYMDVCQKYGALRDKVVIALMLLEELENSLMFFENKEIDDILNDIKKTLEFRSNK